MTAGWLTPGAPAGSPWDGAQLASPLARSDSAVAALGVAGAVVALLAAVAVAAAIGIVAGAPLGGEARVEDPPARPPADIARRYLSLYLQAARRYGLDWAILAGIGKLECDHGRDPDRSCTQEGAVNAAGAGGPAQFIATTWRRYGVDGNGDGIADRWNAADAIFGMANYLRASGAPGDYRRAIFAYNHAQWYVADVLRWAARYRRAAADLGLAGAPVPQSLPAQPPRIVQQPQPVQYVSGSRALLSPIDGHLALVPLQAPPAVQAMVIAGNELQSLPYGPAGHPDPRGAESEDCSSTLNYVLYRAGVRPIQEILRSNPLAQDYIHWGAPGPGRWVTIYATAAPVDHVFVVIAGLRLDTSHEGTDVGPNRDEEGPRWRVFDRIPTWARWTVRHPPGL